MIVDFIKVGRLGAKWFRKQFPSQGSHIGAMSPTLVEVVVVVTHSLMQDTRVGCLNII